MKSVFESICSKQSTDNSIVIAYGRQFFDVNNEIWELLKLAENDEAHARGTRNSCY